MNQNPLLTILEIVLLFNVFMINNSAITHWRGEGKKKKKEYKQRKHNKNFSNCHQKNAISVTFTYFVNILFPSPLLTRTTKPVASPILVG